MVNQEDEDGNRIQGDKFKDGLTDEELEEFYNVMAELKAARETYRNTEAAKAAQAAAADENVTVDATVDEFTDAA